MKGNGIVTDLQVQDGRLINPDGTIYFTGGSASASKFYEMDGKTPSASEGAFHLPVRIFSGSTRLRVYHMKKLAGRQKVYSYIFTASSDTRKANAKSKF